MPTAPFIAPRAAALAFGLFLASTVSTASGATWSLVGGAPEQPAFVVAPVAGQALRCAPGRCDLFTLATSTWTPTPALATLSWQDVAVRLRNGNVVVIRGGSPAVTEIRDAATGAWTRGATLPEPLGSLTAEQLDDGRILLSGTNAVNVAHRTYLADEHLTRWTRAADLLGGAGSPLAATIVVTADASSIRLWRYREKFDRWTELPVDLWSPPVEHALASGSELFVLSRHDTTWRGAVLGAGDRTVAATSFSFGSSPDAFVVTPPPAAPHAPALFLREPKATRTFLWRPGAEPTPLPRDPMGVPRNLVALDAEHFIGLGPNGTVQLLSLDEQPPAGKPCDGLVAYLEQRSGAIIPVEEFNLDTALSPESTYGAPAYASVVTPACREAVRRGEAGTLVAIAHDWSGRPDDSLRTQGRALACAIHDPAAVASLQAWMSDAGHVEARAVCVAELATWPETQGQWGPILANTVRRARKPEALSGWAVDEAVVAAAKARGEPVLREALVDALRTANKRRARGYDRLRKAVCLEDGAASSTRTRACAELPVAAEDVWSARGDRSDHVVGAVVATALVAGAIGGAYAGRNSDVGLAIATGAGSLTGAALGVGLTSLALSHGSTYSRSGSDATGAVVVVGAIGGAVLGGLAAHALAASPGNRTAVTAGGLALPYLVTMVLLFE